MLLISRSSVLNETRIPDGCHLAAPKDFAVTEENAVPSKYGTNAEKRRRQTGMLRRAPLSSAFRRYAKPHNESPDSISPTGALVPADRNLLRAGGTRFTNTAAGRR